MVIGDIVKPDGGARRRAAYPLAGRTMARGRGIHDRREMYYSDIS